MQQEINPDSGAGNDNVQGQIKSSWYWCEISGSHSADVQVTLTVTFTSSCGEELPAQKHKCRYSQHKEDNNQGNDIHGEICIDHI